MIVKGRRKKEKGKAFFLLSFSFFLTAACAGAPSPPAAKPAASLLLITVDTLRADHVGAYGYTRAATPALDALSRGVLFDRAYAAAPITLPSHATILTGRYPPGHGSRDNGIRMAPNVPTLATELKARGFKTAAFIAAFPLDHQFGLDRGFDVYSDRLGRGPDGRLANERPASQVVDEAVAWLRATVPAPPAPPVRFFLWVHLFEPHAPYAGDLSRSAIERYDDEIAAADRAIGQLLNNAATALADTLVVAAGDHGEAFGEHGEWAHSIFVYDTTLRVPLLLRLPSSSGARAESSARRVAEPVTLADVAPTAMRALGFEMKDVDGVDLTPAFAGARLPARELYAESFAPLVEFGWAPLRSVRSGPWKFIAAPRPELYDVEQDAAEQRDVASAQAAVARSLDQRVSRYSGDALPPALAADVNPQAAERLRALGYAAGSGRQASGARPDPKDRRELAARIAQVTAGELSGAALVSALEGIVRDDPGNGQAYVRLGYARLQSGDCARAEPAFERAVAAGLPSADAHMGLATCRGRRRDLAGAERALLEARRIEPDNPVVIANLGILQGEKGDLASAIASFNTALAADPDLHDARFNLAIAYAKAGRRSDAEATARELLRRLPSSLPQRREVEKLLDQIVRSR